MGNTDKDNADFHEHANSGIPPAPGASESAHRGHQAYIKWNADMTRVMSGEIYRQPDQPKNPNNPNDTSNHRSSGDVSAIPAIIFFGGGALGIASFFSENVRYVVGTVFNVVAPSAWIATKAVYEVAATTINNFDLVVAGVGTIYVADKVSSLIDRDDKLYLNSRNLFTACAIALAASATAVYLTATQVRKLGYEIGLTHVTETGANWSGWGRPYANRTFPNYQPIPVSPEPVAQQPVRQIYTQPPRTAPSYKPIPQRPAGTALSADQRLLGRAP